MYASTAKFTAAMERNGIRYSYQGVHSNTKCEIVIVSYASESMEVIPVVFYFTENCEDVAIYVFDLARVPSEKVAAILDVINCQNRKNRYVRFYLNPKENTIELAADACFRESDVGEICLELLWRVVAVCGNAYPEFMKALQA